MTSIASTTVTSNATKQARKITSLIFWLLSLVFSQVNAQNRQINNDIFWNTTDGQPIYSQGGGVFKFPDQLTGKPKFYWYGVHYLEAEAYRKNPSITQSGVTFESVTCYSSDDLVNWKFENDVLTKNEVNKPTKTWVGRLGVAYLKDLKKYVMIVQHGNQVLFALSDTPTGNFKWDHKISMEKLIGTTNTGDQTVFTDDDGKSYLIYSYGRGRNKIYVSEIGVKDGNVDLFDCTQVYQGESREGNCLFKYQNKYYMCASNIYGWDASHAYYMVANNIRGPYSPSNKMLIMEGAADDYAHVTQTGFFVSVKGTREETVLYCGDRWANFAGNGLGYNQWFPISFRDTVPYFNSLSSWAFNSVTGTWAVDEDNNYVRNGSFEADRKRIPSAVKPLQTELTGWVTQILKGNSISVDSSTSPSLSYFNTESDRKIVLGEKSLCIADKIGFKRLVTQQIKSTPYVKLADGVYRLSAKFKNGGNFKTLEMFGESNGKKVTVKIPVQQRSWTNVVINKVTVTSGTLNIGFLAEGSAYAFCYIDDVSLVKIR
jgi:hypothetical protein